LDVDRLIEAERGRVASICSGVDWKVAYMIRTGSPGTRWIRRVTAMVAIQMVTKAARRRWAMKRSMRLPDAAPGGGAGGDAQLSP
jgi:hypothetical protein